MSDLRRKNERVAAQLPVRLQEDDGAITTDLSPSGLFVLTSAPFAVGQVIRFSIEFQDTAASGGILSLACEGEVVRIEEVGEKSGVGVRITESRLERRERRSKRSVAA